MPTRTEYTFAGWSLSSSSSVSIGNSTTSPVTFTMGIANATITAKWTPDTYTLTINTNGSTTTDKINIKFKYGAKRGLEYYTDGYYGYDSTFGKPYREGYLFDGWKVTLGGETIFLITGTASDRPYAYMDDEFMSTGRLEWITKDTSN